MQGVTEAEGGVTKPEARNMEAEEDQETGGEGVKTRSREIWRVKKGLRRIKGEVNKLKRGIWRLKKGLRKLKEGL
ncbi:hypothetical protein R1flu_008760 [Riccia fluitans]|uniref:Uncharacterized protein n=1 Tax=Riccia fluitans TaxID=41844 RepID=A0ABD1XGW0_9MARC